MDYTIIPKFLIYNNRVDYKDFPVATSTTLEHLFFERLIDRPFIKDCNNAPYIITRIFNNAYYICVLIGLEPDPFLYLKKYLQKAGDGNQDLIWEYHVKPATMALAYNLLKYYLKHSEDERLMKDIREIFQKWDVASPQGKEDFFQLIIEGYQPVDLTDCMDFKRRTLSDLFNTIEIKYIADNIDYFIDYITGTCTEEDIKHYLSEILKRIDDVVDWNSYQDDERYCEPYDKVEELMKAYGYIEEEGETPVPDSESLYESETSATLRQQLEEAHNTIKNQKFEIEQQKSKNIELERKLNESLSIANRLKNELDDIYNLGDEDTNYEELWKSNKATNHQRIVFFTTVFSIALDDETRKYYNMGQLALTISCLCNEKPKTIGPMLSRIISANRRIKAKEASEKDFNLIKTLALSAQTLRDNLGSILLDTTKNDKFQILNKIRENLVRNYPISENDK